MGFLEGVMISFVQTNFKRISQPIIIMLHSCEPCTASTNVNPKKKKNSKFYT